MALQKVKKVVNMFSVDDYNEMADEYHNISNQIKQLEERKKKLSDMLKEGAEKEGVKDDKGSFYCESADYVFGKVASKSVKLNQAVALDFLRDKGFDNLIKEEVVYTIDEAGLENEVKSGNISNKDFESLCTVSTSYKVSVKKKEEMPEVEKSSLVAARKK